MKWLTQQPIIGFTQAAVRRPRLAAMVTITVVSMGGDSLFDPIQLEPNDRLEILTRRAATALGASYCKLVTAAGLSLSRAHTVAASGLQHDLVGSATYPLTFYITDIHDTR